MVIRPGLSEVLNIVAAAGSVELGAAQLQIMALEDPRVDDLDEENAIEMATLAAGAIIGSAPGPLQGSFVHSCAYHVLRNIVAASMGRGDLRTALSAQTEINRLIGSVS
jgi:hypothetical protein